MNFITSKIYELSAPKVLYLKDENIDIEGLGEYEIIAETIYSAISPGTETAAYIGTSPLIPGKIYPRVVGYCNVAKIVVAGSKVSAFNIGDYILNFQSHRSAFKFKEGEFALKLPIGIDLKKACTSYLFHLGYHSLITGNVRAGHHVGIIGIGVLGYTTAIMSKLSGAATFVFSNQQPFDSLKKLNIHSHTKNIENLDAIQKKTHQTGLDIIINTSNTWGDWLLALQLVNKGGTIVNLGFPGRGESLPNFNPHDAQYIYVKNLTIKALCSINETEIPHQDIRFNMKRNLEFIIDKIQAEEINPAEIISDEISYTDLTSQYEKYLSKKQTLFTTIINWQ